jgi:integrase/recombinase XerD
MLTLFKRHTKACGQTSRRYRRCGCPMAVEGSLGGEKIRKTLDQTSWEAAENLIREWIKAGKIGGGGLKVVTIEEAVKLFLAEAESRNLAEASMRLYSRFVGRQMPAWCKNKGFVYVSQLTFPELVAFKSSWKMKPATATKRLELLKAFLRFCVSAGWIEKNPAEVFRAPQINEAPTLPYTVEEMNRILEACENYSHHGDHGHNRPARIKAFVLLLRYSGLRIQDAACLEVAKLHGDELMLYTQKSGVPVFVPLPPFVADALRIQGEKNENPRYFFWSGNGKRLSTVSSWQRTLRGLLGAANVSKGENVLLAHRFRDTLACELLQNGVPIEDVAAILGHSVKVCQKHYSAWVQARQVRLTERVKATWPEEKPKLKIIQGGG